jgi:hypothetical protein
MDVEDTGRVPVEYRVAGLDRRTFPIAFAVIALAVLWIYLMPAIDRATRYDDQLRAGDVLDLPAGATLTPTVGWGLQAGQRATDRPATGQRGAPVILTRDGVTMQVTAVPWTGGLDAFLSQINKVNTALSRGSRFHVTGDRSTFQTADGTPGLVEGYTTAGGDGVIAAVLPEGGTGYSIVVSGPPAAVAAHIDNVQAMVASIRVSRQGP